MDSDIDFDYSQVYKINSIKLEYTNPLYYENNIQERFVDNTINIYKWIFNKCCFCLCILPIIFLMYYLLFSFHIFKNQN